MLLQTEIALERIPASPPIGGPLWTLVIPALLLVFASVMTVLLYRRFSKKEG